MKLLKNFTEEELSSHKKGQKIMTDMLREFDSICRSEGLQYWCIGGTLIGAVRHKGWIPHDADIDVSMTSSDYDKFRKIVQKRLSKNFWFQCRDTDKYYKKCPKIPKIRSLEGWYRDSRNKRFHIGLQLDIFVNKQVKNKLIPWVRHTDSQTRKYDFIFPLREIYFEDIKVYVPNKLEEFCEKSWGGFPPPELHARHKYPHEGRISFTIPNWMKEKYPDLYPRTEGISTTSTLDDSKNTSTEETK